MGVKIYRDVNNFRDILKVAEFNNKQYVVKEPVPIKTEPVSFLEYTTYGKEGHVTKSDSGYSFELIA